MIGSWPGGPLVFGTHPGITGNELQNTGPIPDDPARTESALSELQLPGRPQERQAGVFGTVVCAVSDPLESLGVTHFEHFLLRDGDSDGPDTVYQSGLLRSDYSPKPTFETCRRLIRELGA